MNAEVKPNPSNEADAKCEICGRCWCACLAGITTTSFWTCANPYAMRRRPSYASYGPRMSGSSQN